MRIDPVAALRQWAAARRGTACRALAV